MHSKISTSILFLTFLVLFLRQAANGEGLDFLKKLQSHPQGIWISAYLQDLKGLRNDVQAPGDSTSSSTLASKNNDETQEKGKFLRRRREDGVTVTPELLLEEMASLSKVLLSSEIKDNLVATSPAGLYLALGRFIDLAYEDSDSYKELTEKWKINPEKSSPRNLAAFDTYLKNNHINSVSVFYQPLRFKRNSRLLQTTLSTSGTSIVYSQKDLNAIVKFKTQGGITEVTLPEDIDNTQVLYNILNFKFGWYVKFIREEELSDFYVRDGEKQRVSYMSEVGNFASASTNDYMAVKLDFIKDPKAVRQGGKKSERLEDFSGYLVYSKQGKPLDEIWEEVHQSLSQNPALKTEVRLPAFRTRKETEFGSNLFPSLLRSKNPDFPFLSQAANAPFLKIRIKQDIFICVDENGSLGGGVTSTAGIETSLPSKLEFNKPFYYLIAGNKVATPLFVSYVTEGMTNVNDKCS
ncbi:hypothetical protein HMI54_015843 [Coelomomyces lativittatus]|nr:hypothetical protein HMI56_001150 [Coelomomyces lativittatus]KAJ1512215.1 hypothetical protein HMI54_015843 [Coelomomyces lativittatus]KAJ1516713.1 hypothetical protein HMI55_001594 [Coelomomyces lativittatus]